MNNLAQGLPQRWNAGTAKWDQPPQEAGLWQPVSDSDPAPKPGRKNCLHASSPEIQTFQDYNYPGRPRPQPCFSEPPLTAWGLQRRGGGWGLAEESASGVLLVRQREE